MLTARYFNAAGEPAETFELPQDLFDGVVHEPALHQVIKAYLANQRQGTAATKTRGMVSGGKRKAWRQKGTGRARQGSIRAPHWRGGGIVFGPSPRSYHQSVPKKLKALARRSAFNSKALAEQLAVIERFELEAPKTRLVAQLLNRLGLDGRKYLLLTQGVNEMLVRSARNLPNVKVLPFGQASAYEVLNGGQLIIEEAALKAQPAQAETEVVNA
jgi:large subunit ribosomal protein L4